MVGLSVVLESQKNGVHKKSHPQVINKTTMIVLHNTNKPSLPPPSSLFHPSTAFLCRKKLLPGKDIYMYKGDRAFCSVDCRCKQIFTDEEEAAIQKYNSSFAAVRPTTSPAASSLPSPPRHHRKGATNRNGYLA